MKHGEQNPAKAILYKKKCFRFCHRLRRKLSVLPHEFFNINVLSTPAVLDGGLDKAKLQPKNSVYLLIKNTVNRSMGVRF
ncbi:hypothetical protein EQP49_22040 [Yersinia sp. 2105 StPb PI]|nr:hypothetical protein EQP49_22040 [Yersinia sp. 2105 StPb PI]